MNSDNYSADTPPPVPPYDDLFPGSYNGAVPEFEEPLQPIDQIAIRKLGGFNFLTIRQWEELTSEMQMRRIQREEVVFLSRGQEVPVREALSYLKSLRNTEPLDERYRGYPPPSGRPDRQ